MKTTILTCLLFGTMGAFGMDPQRRGKNSEEPLPKAKSSIFRDMDALIALTAGAERDIRRAHQREIPGHTHNYMYGSDARFYGIVDGCCLECYRAAQRGESVSSAIGPWNAWGEMVTADRMAASEKVIKASDVSDAEIAAANTKEEINRILLMLGVVAREDSIKKKSVDKKYGQKIVAVVTKALPFYPNLRKIGLDFCISNETEAVQFIRRLRQCCPNIERIDLFEARVGAGIALANELRRANFPALKEFFMLCSFLDRTGKEAWKALKQEKPSWGIFVDFAVNPDKLDKLLFG